MYDVIIIGGGVTGTAIARELSRYELKVLLLEKEAELAFGISKSNSGIIHSGTQNAADSLKGKLCAQGNRLVRLLSKELGVDFKGVGSLIVAFEESEIEELKSIKKDAQILGVPGLRIVHPKWLKAHEPNLSNDVIAALYAPTAGIISPYRFTYDLGENAARNGIEIYTSCRVKNIIRNNPYFDVLTAKGIYNTRYIVNAAGLFADEISTMAGVNDFKIQPRKGEEFILDKKREHLTNHVIFPLPTKTSKGILVTKTSDGNPMIGPSADDIKDKEDLSTSQEGMEKVFSSAKRLIPSVTANDIIAYFAGLRPVAGHDFIIRHENKAPGLINTAGIQSPGLTAAPAIALMVCDLLEQNGLGLKKKRIFYGHQKEESHLFAIPFSRARKLIKMDKSYGDIVCRCEMVSAKEVEEAIERGATTLDGIKFRTRAQAGRCHGGFCTTRIMRILSVKTKTPLTEITKRGKGSEIVKEERRDA